MTKSEFVKMVVGLPPGEWVRTPYEIFGSLFPPDARADASREAAYAFAQEHGLTISNRPDDPEGESVVWIKD